MAGLISIDFSLVSMYTLVNILIKITKEKQMEIRWCVIKDFPNYSVSEDGRVRRTKQSGNNHKKNKVLKPAIIKSGYYQVKLYNDELFTWKKIHRIVLSHFQREPLPGEQGNHKDGVKSNNHNSNLEWVTGSENVRHAIKNGLWENRAKGERQGSAKLTCEKVKEIKEMLKISNELTKIGNLFGVNKCTISDIKEGRTWNHVK